MHIAQAKILEYLLLNLKGRYNQLNLTNLTTDHFNFHVKQLLKKGLTEKRDHFYFLTLKGKEQANRIDRKNFEIARPQKIVAVICCTKDRKYLVRKRLRSPFFGAHDLVSGKIRFGEKLFDGAQRVLREKTSLVADLFLVGVEHKYNLDSAGKIIEDLYLFVFWGDDPRGELINKTSEGENFWLTKRGILKLENLFPNIPIFLNMLDNRRKFKFMENGYKTPEY